MKIQPLYEIPEAVIPIAEYNFNEWGHKRPDDSVEKTIARIQERLNNRKPPLTLVAYENENYIGSATLNIREMIIYPEKEYWLGSLFVVSGYRRRGFGSLLVSEIENLAKSFSIHELNLYTPNQESLYKKLGWTTDEYVEYEKETVAVMSKKLKS
ncbi:MAG: GNAT family N-acetyltransferase [Proteobacteria bacterium]|nr:GNAT family N-acetyltransferase [Pseudomonadota bacterium]